MDMLSEDPFPQSGMFQHMDQMMSRMHDRMRNMMGGMDDPFFKKYNFFFLILFMFSCLLSKKRKRKWMVSCPFRWTRFWRFTAGSLYFAIVIFSFLTQSIERSTVNRSRVDMCVPQRTNLSARRPCFQFLPRHDGHDGHA